MDPPPTAERGLAGSLARGRCCFWLLALTLTALAACGALSRGADAAPAKGYGELTRFGEATTGTPAAKGVLRAAGVHLIGVDPDENDVYVLDEPQPQEEIENEKTEEPEITRFFRVQKFNDAGGSLASVSFAETEPGEEEEEFEQSAEEEPRRTIEGIAVDAKLKRLYVLVVGLRDVEPDEEAPVASALYAFSTEPNKAGELVGVGGKKILAGPGVLGAQSTEAGKALLEPAGITVDPANDDVLILAHEDAGGAATDDIASAEDHYVVQAITSKGALSTRYVDHGNVLKQVRPGTEELMAYPDSPVVSGPEGSEHVVVNYGGSLVEIPADLSSTTPPEYLYEEPPEASAFPVATGASLMQGGALSVSREGVIFGMAHIEDELELNDEQEPGVVLRSAASGAEIGWTGGQSPETADGEDCLLEPGEEGSISDATVAAGSEGKIFVLAPDFLAQEGEHGAGTRAIVELGPGGSGCPQASASPVYAEVDGREIEEGEPVPVHKEVTLDTELLQADSLASHWSFGDGEEETVALDQYQFPQSNPHEFQKPGEYTVTTTISSDDLAEPNQVIFDGSQFHTPTLSAQGEVLVSGPPSATTGEATSLTKTSATLHGTVNPNSFEVSECVFEYGTTLPSGKTVACESLPGAGASPVSVSAPVSGLEADTTYSYRLIAKNEEGSGEGAQRTFTTLPNAPAVTAEAPSGVTQTTATLHASVDPNGGTVKECRFEYGTSTAYGKSVECSSLPGGGHAAVPVSAPVSGLEAQKTYDFRIVVANSGGSGEGEDSFETLAPSPPTVETEAATSVTQSAATLNATVDPNGSELKECSFEYGTSLPSGQLAPCASTPGRESAEVPVSGTIGGLAPASTYLFRIIAKNEAGPAVEGEELSFTTAAPAPAGESPPGTGSSSSSSSSSAASIVGAGSSQPVVSPLVPLAPPLPDAVLAGASSFTASRSGTIVVKVSCPVSESSCAGTITLRTLKAVIASAKAKKKPAILTLASGTFQVAVGHVVSVTLHLSAAALTLLARTHVVSARATVLAHDPAGATHTSTSVVTIHAAKRKR